MDRDNCSHLAHSHVASLQELDGSPLFVNSTPNDVRLLDGPASTPLRGATATASVPAGPPAAASAPGSCEKMPAGAGEFIPSKTGKKTKRTSREAAETTSAPHALPAAASASSLSGGHRAGSGAPAPHRIDSNTQKLVDHAFFTMDYVSAQTPREHLVAVGQAAFGAGAVTDRSGFRGVVVKEKHADGQLHLHGAFWSSFYFPKRDVVSRARDFDFAERGWKSTPNDDDGGVKWHINVLSAHVYSPECKQVKSGVKNVGSFKAAWRFGDMVQYLLKPAKGKAQYGMSPVAWRGTVRNMSSMETRVWRYFLFVEQPHVS